MGVEEEFLLVDARTRAPASRAPRVLACADELPPGADGASVKAELLETQAEAATGVCVSADDLATQLRAGRARLAAAARHHGARIVSTGTPVLPGPEPVLTTGKRFQAISDTYQGIVARYQASGCHVHVEVKERDTAVAVLNHLRPWLPTLLALSANSPFDGGRDSGHASWRMVEQSRFPGSGVPPWCSSAHEYDRRVDALVDAGVLVDPSMSFWLARASSTLPTVEFRVADACVTPDEAVLQALLSRALVRAALDDLAAGREAPPADEEFCRAAVWSAARYGLNGPAVDPVARRQVPAEHLLQALLERVTPALHETGDHERVQTLLAGVRRLGTGAERQRREASRGLLAVVDMLADATSAEDDLRAVAGGPGGAAG
ncbi:carboxylate-amine ligase [Actinomadura fibrosa]|uniref:Putative glutamate--cysteine ligase 2 n=1 Tax=Actinomadura fibrosa TaxID=111802 RepID=A0ABW2Y0H3_9ACTN|nr:glutamate--cysteine ligase [Actinomadura fibrosa]